MNINLAMLSLIPMQSADLEEVMAIEQAVYTHPWSRAHFIDSLQPGYDAWLARSADGVLLGYYVQMPVMDESDLLTIAVLAEAQGQGIARVLLEHMVCRAQSMKLTSIALEVRASNLRALSVYTAFGFVAVGRRKAYYQTRQHEREDALILRYILAH